MPLDTGPSQDRAIEVLGPGVARTAEVLTPEALTFVCELHARFERGGAGRLARQPGLRSGRRRPR